ncbi:ethanolamine ammonia-lyase reactivating factor EutA [Phytohabitans sp. ZYX-F-186]|uniref:Ethanolamine ammonia-lyase reactivating factor EutA n=1 Tax=Phytohabitans maris TaxID=3071409 RepID=A0ABU0ZRE8_9ACTN|nr:ethanolamine ammonia-lyase reactivating factor EutA [Phytohabitans sp. ZYX-F-186]MDQ7908904.1 ethanolamine ammonia-lyase reactivating factor EutA [Phytohabitans sp. ZYX-F-186]
MDRGHSLHEHALGAYASHEHGPDADHDHDDPATYGPPEASPLYAQDNVTLTSVGIDIGSAGTQVVFSRIHMRRLGERLTSRYVTVGREAVYRSPVHLTPYAAEHRLDHVALAELVDRAYRAAGLRPDGLDTGVVILTGEALRRENAAGVSAALAADRGDFVCASAGHHMEAMLAAYGSGAVRRSHGTGKRLLNIDIGGGTTKLTLVAQGQVARTAAFHVGGRLVAVDGRGTIARLEPAGRRHASRCGYDWRVGDPVAPEALDRVAQDMADLLVSALVEWPPGPRARPWWLTDPFPALDGVDAVMFSGGVAEYVYGRERRDFGDLGARLGPAVRERLAARRPDLAVLPAGECIRATALGASEHTVQLSGNTCHISHPGTLLPRRSLQVVRVPVPLPTDVDPARVAAALRERLVAFDVADESDAAIAIGWQGPPSHRRLRALADGLVTGLAKRTAAGRPLLLMLDGDVAMSLGAILAGECGVRADLLVLDGLALHDFDYVDIGRVRLPSRTVPVTIKSLVFAVEGAAASGTVV